MNLVAGLDIETTGLKQEKGDRIVEIALQLWEPSQRRLVRSFTQRVNPLRTIPPKASEIHGIFLEDLRDAPTWDKVAPLIGKALSLCKWIVCHNVAFDVPFVALELHRVGLRIPNAEVYCTMENGRWATAEGKFPKLGELCGTLGVPYDKAAAHAADYDVSRTMDCLWAGIDRGVFRLEEPA